MQDRWTDKRALRGQESRLRARPPGRTYVRNGPGLLCPGCGRQGLEELRGAPETWPQLLASPAGATLLPVSRVISPAIRSARVSTECGTRLASGPLKYSAQQWAPPSLATSAPEAAPLNGAWRQVSPVRRPDICIIYARGGPPRPLPLPERARNYCGPIGCAARPLSRLRAKPAWESPGSETEAGAAGD